jgi:hypothetical protein
MTYHFGLGRRFPVRRKEELRDAHDCRGTAKAAILPNAAWSSTTA